jgi:hypothetical protein
LDLDIQDLPSASEKDNAREILNKFRHSERPWDDSPTLSLMAQELSCFFEQVNWALLSPSLVERDRFFRAALETYETSQLLEQFPHSPLSASDQIDDLNARELSTQCALFFAASQLRDLIMGAKFDMNRRVSSSFRQSLSFIEEADELFF